VRMTRELDEIIKKYIPKHEIPDDPEAMAAMGLPSELIYKDLTHEEWEETKKRNEEAEGKWMRGHKPEDFPLPDDVKKRLEEAMRELGIEDMSSSANPTENPPTTVTDQEKVQPESKSASAESSQDAGKHEPEPEPGKKEIKTTRFGRGFNDWVKE